jgi:hypothetical protein
MTLRDRLDRWFEELWVRRNGAIIDEMVDPECTIHGLPGVKHGPNGLRPFYELLGRAFSRMEIRIDESVEEGDRIGFRCTVTALARDGTAHQFTGGGLVKFRGERMIEAWNVFDHLSLMTTMGHVSSDTFVNAMLAQAKLAAS